MSPDHLKALLLLSGIGYTKTHEIKNKYWPDAYPDMIAKYPWWLVQTPLGMIEIGWRKRVISINWSDTGWKDPHYVPNAEPKYRGRYEGITKDDTTKDATFVHAWSYADAVKYLTTLRHQLESEAHRRANPVPAEAT